MSSASISFPMLGDWSICPPNSFTLFGHEFYWYGVIIACGFLLAVLYCFRRCGQFGVTQDDLVDCLLFAVPIAIICARIYYVVFFGGYHSFWDMCKIWEGGLAIYGGIIGAVLTVLAVCRFKRISPLAVLDVVSFGLLIGQSVGRWGNFMNREAFGAETDIFCRMGLTMNGHTVYVHPTFLYESLWNLAGFAALHMLSKKFRRRFDGQYFLTYAAWYGLGRLWIEGLRADSLFLGNTGIRVSQLLAGVTFLAAAALLMVLLLRRRNAPALLWAERAAAAAGPGETPVNEEAPEDEEAPVDEELPADEEVPEDEEAPVDEELPEDEEVPADEGAPKDEEVPADEEVPVDEEVPADEGAPKDEEAPEDEETLLDDGLSPEEELLVDEGIPEDDEPFEDEGPFEDDDESALTGDGPAI